MASLWHAITSLLRERAVYDEKVISLEQAITRYEEINTRLHNRLRQEERRHYLAPPLIGSLVPLSALVPLLPVTPSHYTDDPLTVLPLQEWQRFVAWVTPVARARPYVSGVIDCDDFAAIFNGRATEWAPNLAKGLVYGTTAKGIAHLWNFVFALEGGPPRLFWVDMTPRSVVPAWKEDGLEAALPAGWQVTELMFL